SQVAIREFQSTHGLTADGVVGPETQAAVRALRAESGGELDVSAVGVDSGDAQAIRRLQRRLALPVSGRIDGMTRGALRLLQHPGVVDPLDEHAVGRFQRAHGLEGTGVVDEPTRVAMAAVLADPGGVEEDDGDRRLPPGALDPVARFRDLDAADERSVTRFQKSLNIPASGDIDAETRGAMRALRAWLVVDPTDGEAVREVQRRHGLLADGIIGPRTRDAIAQERQVAAEKSAAPPLSEPDPYHEESVRAFQQRHHLAQDGTIGPATRARILWERDHHTSVDAAWADSVRHFQAQHGLTADGIVGEQTRAAMRAARHEREVTGNKERRERYGDDAAAQDGRILDPTDVEAVRRFQRAHRLRDDARIGPRTRTAMRSVRRERALGDGNPPDHDDHNEEDAR
ncbi:MAG TPA: peptidoglycan-binding protein, partial [Solirubrobacteraceae bacterium]|nr:peptidoglycan-binding protein [Solirubrobacteraceae bacterium]